MKMSHCFCSFCGRGNKEVEIMIAGCNVYICGDCVELSTEKIKEKRRSKMDDKTKEIREEYGLNPLHGYM